MIREKLTGWLLFILLLEGVVLLTILLVVAIVRVFGGGQ